MQVMIEAFGNWLPSLSTNLCARILSSLQGTSLLPLSFSSQNYQRGDQEKPWRGSVFIACLEERRQARLRKGFER